MNWKRFLADYAPMFAIWLAIVLFFGAISQSFLTVRTLTTIAGQVPPLALICCGMTLVLIIGGIDLSVGSVLALSGSVLSVLLARTDSPLPLAIAAALATGGAMGLFNGALSVWLRIPSFIVTLGTLKIAFGLAMLVTAAETVTVGTRLEPFVARLGDNGLPVSFVLALLVAVFLQLVLTRTVYGRHLIAIGTNESAVRLAGVPTQWKRISVFGVTGLLVGLASVFFAARLGGANADAGNGLELSAIAAVVIGGTSLMGGRGSVINSFLGAMIILTLEAGLAQVGASEWAKHIITGVVIVIAVLMEAIRGNLFPRFRLMAARFRSR